MKKLFLISVISLLFFSCNSLTKKERKHAEWVAHNNSNVSLFFSEDFFEGGKFTVKNYQKQQLLIDMYATAAEEGSFVLQRVIFVKQESCSILFPHPFGWIKVYRLNEYQTPELLYGYRIDDISLEVIFLPAETKTYENPVTKRTENYNSPLPPGGL